MKYLLLALAIGFTAMACRDRNEPQDQLPPITQHGANTAGCIINGQIIIPKNGMGTIPGSGIAYGLRTVIDRDPNLPQKILSLKMRISNIQKKNDYSFFMHLDTIEIPKTYYTMSIKECNPVCIIEIPYVYVTKFNDKGKAEKFYYSDKNSCKITLTKVDLQSGIISGTFLGEVYNEQNKNDKVSITDGRFDINIGTVK